MFMLHAILVHVHLAQFYGIGNAVPDKIETAFPGPQIVIESGYWVGDHLLALWQVKRKEWIDAAECFGCKVGFVGRPPPDIVAGVDGLDIRRHLRPHA